MRFNLPELIDSIVSVRSSTSNFHEAANVVALAGIRNPVSFLTFLRDEEIIAATGEAVDAGSPLVYKWARPSQLFA